MANKNIFKRAEKFVADTVNHAGGKAYAKNAKAVLAQIAATNCFNGTFYASADANLEKAKQAVLELRSDPEFIAKAALYARKKAYMKDMPAFLCNLLADIDTELFGIIFESVIDNGKMLRNFVQIARAGVVTGKPKNVSSGAIRKAINHWFHRKDPEYIFHASIGNDPSMKDILSLCHPKPMSKEHAALFAYLYGAKIEKDKLVVGDYKHLAKDLPKIVQQYEAFKSGESKKIPDVDFRLLDSLDLTSENWIEIAKNAGWTMTRMNLNTFARHGVFKNKQATQIIADRLKNADEVKNSRCFPYQILAAYRNATADVPLVVRDALQDAMEIAIDNVPEIPGTIYVCVDCSGSMSNAITGYRAGATSSVSCVDVAGLIAAAMLRTNKHTEIVPFHTEVLNIQFNSRDSVMTNAGKFMAGGGTDCSCALQHLNQKNASGDLVIYVSDNESWADIEHGQATGLMHQWQKFKQRNKQAKLVCIDLTPNETSQVAPHQDILMVGGFSDNVFDVMKTFVENTGSVDHWVAEIESIELPCVEAKTKTKKKKK